MTTRYNISMTKEQAEARIARLQTLNVNNLQKEWVLLFGTKPYTTNNRQFLIKRLTWRIKCILNGGLSDRALMRAEAIADEPYIRLQPQKYKVERVKTISNEAQPPKLEDLERGTVLRRVYKGKTHEVTILGASSFAYEGVRYDNLTAIAWKICGYPKSGNSFFNLSPTPRKTANAKK